MSKMTCPPPPAYHGNQSYLAIRMRLFLQWVHLSYLGDITPNWQMHMHVDIHISKVHRSAFHVKTSNCFNIYNCNTKTISLVYMYAYCTCQRYSFFLDISIGVVSCCHHTDAHPMGPARAKFYLSGSSILS